MSATYRELGIVARLSLPVVLTQIGMMLIGFVDTIMVGRLGVRELAASALANLWQWTLAPRRLVQSLEAADDGVLPRVLGHAPVPAGPHADVRGDLGDLARQRRARRLELRARLRAARSALSVAAAFQLSDGTQVVASGLLRGMARPDGAAVANLFGYYVVGLPLGYLLGFRWHLGLVGIWLGLVLGLAVVAGTLLAWVRTTAQRPLAELAARSD